MLERNPGLKELFEDLIIKSQKMSEDDFWRTYDNNGV